MAPACRSPVAATDTARIVCLSLLLPAASAFLLHFNVYLPHIGTVLLEERLRGVARIRRFRQQGNTQHLHANKNAACQLLPIPADYRSADRRPKHSTAKCRHRNEINSQF
jgi:hypothetical protein